jgi:glycosyltransferase involved in cell wall biosynthesis
MSAVHVIPSSVDLSNYPIRLSGFRNGAVAFGWIGSPENLGDFSSIHGALTKAFNEINGRAVVKIVSAEPLELNGVPVQWEPWVLDRDMNYLHSFDVGLMPLQNSERSRGRCGFKAIQYMAAGLPVVASPVGAATEIVEPWESGLLPTSDEEWREAIELLSRDAALRSRLGLSGRAQVEARFSIQVNAPKLARILGEVAAS